ncbi:hypothetical protein PATSB16_33560 [Pandoraea thiooxydans]|nr:hypothetical protein PATSB16_33560 [Pandoraea thiooxydans]
MVWDIGDLQHLGYRDSPRHPEDGKGPGLVILIRVAASTLCLSIRLGAL